MRMVVRTYFPRGLVQSARAVSGEPDFVSDTYVPASFCTKATQQRQLMLRFLKAIYFNDYYSSMNSIKQNY